MADQASRGRYVHLYHSKAVALEGTIESPFEHFIPRQIPLEVEEKGGYFSLRSKEFRFEELISFASAHTQVSGAPNRKPSRNGNPTTLASAVVEGLNIRDVLTCDRIVAQITTDHPADGQGAPTISFLGTHFENLKIGGKRVEVEFDLDLCDHDVNKRAESCINNPRFQKKLESRYHERGGDEKTPHVLCSLVSKIDGRPGHVIDLPEFGKVYLGELTVEHKTYRLTMIRTELGCSVHGSTKVANLDVNGGGK